MLIRSSLLMVFSIVFWQTDHADKVVCRLPFQEIQTKHEEQ